MDIGISGAHAGVKGARALHHPPLPPSPIIHKDTVWIFTRCFPHSCLVPSNSLCIVTIAVANY